MRQYSKEQSAYDAAEERALGERFRANGYVTKYELERVVAWKFQGYSGDGTSYVNI